MSYSDETPDFFKNLLLNLGFTKQRAMTTENLTHYKRSEIGMSIYLDEDVKILPSGFIKKQLGIMMNNYGFEEENIFKEMKRARKQSN